MQTQRRIQVVPTDMPAAALPSAFTEPGHGLPHPEIASVLQEANDLLLLIRDEAIWRSLLVGGLAPDAQTQLADCLATARRSYLRWRAASDNRLAAKQRDAALVRLQRIVSAIGKVGRYTFSTTDSLRLRFSSRVHEQPTEQHPKPAA